MCPDARYVCTHLSDRACIPELYGACNRACVCVMCVGVVKQTLPFDDPSGGGPCALDCNRDYLAAVSAAHTLRVYKVAGREAKPHQGPGRDTRTYTHTHTHTHKHSGCIEGRLFATLTVVGCSTACVCVCICVCVCVCHVYRCDVGSRG